MTKRLYNNTKYINFRCKNVMNVLGFLFQIAHCCFKFLKQGKFVDIVTGKGWCSKDYPIGGLEIPCLLTIEGTMAMILAIKEDIKQKRKPQDKWKI